MKAQVAGRAVLLVQHRSETDDEAALPADYRRILAIVRAVGGMVQVQDGCKFRGRAAGRVATGWGA
ncbi:hypothetical protein [Streptomyces sp. HC307]|uniref:hypothetical protein n=1 Tax=Streptomyces flavusporus TaxID=3385496 RepID=UPI003917589D